MQLSDTEKNILDFEQQHWKYAGAKEAAIREQFGVSLTRHTQRLNALLDRPEALAYAPATVKRLRRLRDARRAVRSSLLTA